MRVLVADDESTSRLLAGAIERLSHECEVAADGLIAWDMLQAGDFDVLITDWMMPGLDGPELCRRVRASRRDSYTYILLATSLSADTDIIVGMQAGADDYLVKPVDPFALQTRLIAAQRVTELHHELGHAKLELAKLARTDPLTQLSNRLRLHEDLVAVHERARRSQRPFAVALCDLDGFKSYNDTYGHLEATKRSAVSVWPSPTTCAPATARTGTEARSSSSSCPTRRRNMPSSGWTGSAARSRTSRSRTPLAARPASSR